jgi:tripartite-type tricarboxylate transporter receptor subunit TctC
LSSHVQPSAQSSCSGPRGHFRFGHWLGWALAGLWVLPAWAADPWPSKPITLVVPFAAGGGVDNVARALAAQMAEGMQHTVVVENRVGAGGIVGAKYVASSAPDGHTLLMGTQTTLAVVPLLNKSAAFSPLNAFAGVSQVGSSPMLLVSHPSLNVKTLPELLARAKERPGQLNFGSGGVGTSPHMAGALLEIMSNTRMTHIAYKGEQPALTDLMGNQIQWMFSNVPASMPLVKSGKLTALAISSAQRSSAATVVAPRDTPRAVVERLSAEVGKALDNPKLLQRLEAQGLTVQKSTPAQSDKYIASEYEKWGRVVRESNISTD